MIDPHQEESPNSTIIRTSLNFTLNDQRHSIVYSIIKSLNVIRLLDLGCSYGQFLRLAARSPNLELIVGVDLDETSVGKAVMNALPEPLQNSIQYDRKNDLRVQVYRGDLLQHYSTLKQMNFQMITMIEVIEHLPLESIETASNTIFNFLRPQHVIMTTPNRDFNVHFKDKTNRLRHWDHKFQWSRSEFNQFCQQICHKYGYTYELKGIGEHVSDQSQGCCTQMAVFTIQPLSQTSLQFANHTYLQKEGAKDHTRVQLQLRQEYNIPCWKSQLDRIMMDIFYDGLRWKQEETFEELLDYVKKCSPLAKCLESNNITLDIQYLSAYVMKFGDVFQWDETKYGRVVREGTSYDDSHLADEAEELAFDEFVLNNELQFESFSYNSYSSDNVDYSLPFLNE